MNNIQQLIETAVSLFGIALGVYLIVSISIVMFSPGKDI
jgi:hypothetical protein